MTPGPKDQTLPETLWFSTGVKYFEFIHLRICVFQTGKSKYNVIYHEPKRFQQNSEKQWSTSDESMGSSPDVYSASTERMQ